MESHDLNSDQSLDALLKASKPAPLPDAQFSAQVVSHLPPARPLFDWPTLVVLGSIVAGLLLVLRQPQVMDQARLATSTVANSLNTWNAVGIGFALLVCAVALVGDPLNEESRD